MITELDQLIPPEQYKPFLKGRPLDYLQPLVDLGFLHLSKTENQKAVRIALAEFRQDCQSLSWLSSQFTNNKTTLPPADEPDSLEIKLLHLLVDMDGDFQLSKLPEKGSLNILSRVIYYRLRLHGFWKPSKAPQLFDPNILKAVVIKLNSWIPLNISPLEWVNLLGDIPELIRRTYDHGGLDEQIVCFKYRPQTGFKNSFRQEVTKESEETIASETFELQKIKSALTDLQNDSVTMVGKESRVATTRKNLQHQSEVERLRVEINRVVEELQGSLKKKHQTSDRFESAILSAKEELEINKSKEDHLKMDINELKSTVNLLDDLKGNLKKNQKKNKRLRKELKELFSNSPDLKSQLFLQLEIKKKLVEKQLEAPQSLKHKFDKPLASADKKIKLLKKYSTELEQIRIIEKRLLDRKDIKDRIVLKNQELKTLKEKLNQVESGLEILIKKQKEEVDEVGERISIEQKKLRKISKRYQVLLKKLEKIPRRFRRELKENLTPAFYEKIRRELLNQENSTLFTETLNHPYNQFLVRLLQLHQWINGYYNGLIDSDLGRRTFSSIREIKKDIKRMKLRFVLYQLNARKGTWLLNIRYLFAEMIDSLESFQEQDDFETVVLNYEKQITSNPKIRSQKKRIEQEFNKTIKEINKNRIENKMRRVYFGVRSLARSIVRGMGRLIKLILKGIRIIYRLLRNFVLLLYREIREGLRKFGQGIAFLFGKRQIITSSPDGQPAIVTRFDFDCDVKSFVSLNATQYATEHSIKCQNITHNLEFALTLTAKIIEWTLKAVTMSWATILIRIAFYFKKQIKIFLRKNLLNLTVGALS